MRPAMLGDIPAVVAVGRACNLAEIGEFDVHESWVHDEWVRPRFEPSTNAWVVMEPGGEIVAAAYTWDEEPHTLFDSTGWVHPEHRGRGIGTSLVLTVERRAVRDLSRATAGSVPRVLQSYDADASGAFDPDASGAGALLEGLGYSRSASTCTWRSTCLKDPTLVLHLRASRSDRGSRPTTARSSP